MSLQACRSAVCWSAWQEFSLTSIFFFSFFFFVDTVRCEEPTATAANEVVCIPHCIHKPRHAVKYSVSSANGRNCCLRLRRRGPAGGPAGRARGQPPHRHTFALCSVLPGALRGAALGQCCVLCALASFVIAASTAWLSPEI